MERIKTNIVELSKLYRRPSELWLKRFKHGKIDAHKAFKVFRQQYEWLYYNSPYDLIGWEIENNVFNWEENGWAVAKFCPQYLDHKHFNWGRHGWAIAIYC